MAHEKVSVSDLVLFSTCEKRFHYRRALGARYTSPQRTSKALMGTLIHAIMDRINKIKMKRAKNERT